MSLDKDSFGHDFTEGRHWLLERAIIWRFQVEQEVPMKHGADTESCLHGKGVTIHSLVPTHHRDEQGAILDSVQEVGSLLC